ncbi:MAG: hypothetical protein JWP11_142 [Frankiales bacterium]|nr:hypothetical protein [Frankiales bacterium]
MSNKKSIKPPAGEPVSLDPNEWLTPDYITQDLRVSLNTWYQWRSAGKAPKAIKVGKHVRVRRRDYEAWLATLVDVAP